jgi:hypothetical protein
MKKRAGLNNFFVILLLQERSGIMKRAFCILLLVVVGCSSSNISNRDRAEAFRAMTNAYERQLDRQYYGRPPVTWPGGERRSSNYYPYWYYDAPRRDIRYNPWTGGYHSAELQYNPLTGGYYK